MSKALEKVMADAAKKQAAYVERRRAWAESIGLPMRKLGRGVE